MESYGWVKAYPMHVARNTNGRLIIVDGQHRFEIAKELGLPVWFVETENHVDVVVINNSQKAWSFRDYAGSFAQRGSKDYQKLLDFADKHSIPVSAAVSMLSGTCSSNRNESYKSGKWHIEDEQHANKVVSIYITVCKYTKALGRDVCIGAISACCRISGFSVDRMISQINRCPEKLMQFSTSDAMLTMFEGIYNFGRRDIQPLKIEAEKITRARSCIQRKKA
jgi:hypothetical protein